MRVSSFNLTRSHCARGGISMRSEEHTSELQALTNLVYRSLPRSSVPSALALQDALPIWTNNLCDALAVEKLLGIEIPPRAQWLRVMMNELTRINSHLVWLDARKLVQHHPQPLRPRRDLDEIRRAHV